MDGADRDLIEGGYNQDLTPNGQQMIAERLEEAIAELQDAREDAASWRRICKAYMRQKADSTGFKPDAEVDDEHGLTDREKALLAILVNEVNAEHEACFAYFGGRF
jgi:hypothetical protein